MDIKDLNKSQLILLAILLSFVTSIATGITTVTLMQQAPTSFTAPVNRVIQQTVEKIQQVEGKTVTQTVVVKEEDLVVDAIDRNQSALFNITKEVTDENGKTIEISAGRGFVINSDGVIVVDGTQVFDSGVYYVKNDSGKFKADFIALGDKLTISFIKIGVPVDEKNKVSFTVPDFGDLNKMKIGQKIITVGNGINSFIYEGDKDFKTSVSRANSGSIVLNLDGEVLGIALNGDTSFVPVSSINESFKSKDSTKTQ